METKSTLQLFGIPDPIPRVTRKELEIFGIRNKMQLNINCAYFNFLDCNQNSPFWKALNKDSLSSKSNNVQSIINYFNKYSPHSKYHTDFKKKRIWVSRKRDAFFNPKPIKPYMLIQSKISKDSFRLFILNIRKINNKNFIIKNRPRTIRTINQKIKYEIFERDNYTCQLCNNKGKRAGGKEIPLVVDHVIPVNMGGSNHKDNLQTLCLRCNCRKSDRIIIKYIEEGDINGKAPRSN